jgi:hypothetical protein
MRRIAAALVLLAALAGTAEAQKVARANTRQGFWIGFGLGLGSAGVDCASCSTERTNGTSGYLRLGGTLSPSFLIGVETNGFTKTENGVDNLLSFGSVVGYWYPSRTGALYLKLGLGAMMYSADDGTDRLEATSAGAVLGVGYEFRVRNNMSVVPFLNSMASGNTDFKLNGQTVATNAEITFNLVQVGIGLTWH